MSAQVERWRYLAAEALRLEKSDTPIGLILAIIEGESDGEAGAIASVPMKGGHALGLMQCGPDTVLTYNRNHRGGATYSQMTGTDDASALVQLRCGVWAFENSKKKIGEYLENRTGRQVDLIPLALCGYAMGNAGTIAQLDKLCAPSFDGLRLANPNWGKPGNDPYGSTLRKLARANAYGSAVPVPAADPVLAPQDGAATCPSCGSLLTVVLSSALAIALVLVVLR